MVLQAACCIAMAVQSIPATPAGIDWTSLAESTLGKAVLDREVPGAAVVVVGSEATLFSSGFGVGDLETMAPVTDTTLFDVGSIGKVLTTIAVLQQQERGRVDLGTDVNTYLDGWTIETTDPPLTLHHLLTHTGGLNDRAIGYASRTADDVAPLDEHLAANFPTFFATPGRYVSYSNYGFGLAGLIVESVTGTPFAEYVASDVLGPLGIADSGYRPGADAVVATGYLKRNDAFPPAPELYRPVTPAGSFVANARDMAAILRTFLRNGAPILSSDSLAMMTSVQHTHHAGLMGNAYGLEESRWGRVRGFGKGGMVPGFVATMIVVPEHDLGLFVAVNASSDDAIDRFVLDAMRLLSADEPASRPPKVMDVGRFVGEYRNNRYDRTSVEKLLRMEVHHVYGTDDGGLVIWHDGAMNRYHPVDTLVFEHTENPNRLLVFEEDAGGTVTHAFFNDRIAGGYVPVAWERPGYFNSNLYINEHFGIVLLIALGYLLFPVVAAWRCVWARRKPEATRLCARRRASRWRNLVGLGTSALLLAYVVLYVIPLMRARPELIFGIPARIEVWRWLPVIIMSGFAVFAGFWIHAVWRRRAGWPGLVVGALFLASGVLVGEFFVRWNLLL
ncbi:MAG: serine hydrolase domain-containing protein [Planctomycetota bacterium]|jgi:CubicO group peptidase (beta-lactamase class C family)